MLWADRQVKIKPHCTPRELLSTHHRKIHPQFIRPSTCTTTRVTSTTFYWNSHVDAVRPKGPQYLAATIHSSRVSPRLFYATPLVMHTPSPLSARISPRAEPQGATGIFASTAWRMRTLRT